MEIQPYSELRKALTSKFNWLLFGFSAFFMVDYMLGSTLIIKLITLHLEWRGLQPPYRLFAIFGTFDNIFDLSRRLELVLFGFCFVGVLGPIMRGWLGGLRMKK